VFLSSTLASTPPSLLRDFSPMIGFASISIPICDTICIVQVKNYPLVFGKLPLLITTGTATCIDATRLKYHGIHQLVVFCTNRVSLWWSMCWLCLPLGRRIKRQAAGNPAIPSGLRADLGEHKTRSDMRP